MKALRRGLSERARASCEAIREGTCRAVELEAAAMQAVGEPEGMKREREADKRIASARAVLDSGWFERSSRELSRYCKKGAKEKEISRAGGAPEVAPSLRGSQRSRLSRASRAVERAGSLHSTDEGV